MKHVKVRPTTPIPLVVSFEMDLARAALHFAMMTSRGQPDDTRLAREQLDEAAIAFGRESERVGRALAMAHRADERAAIEGMRKP